MVGDETSRPPRFLRPLLFASLATLVFWAPVAHSTESRALAGADASSSVAELGEPEMSCQLALPSNDSSQPVGRTECPGVKPGAIVVADQGSCTMNFLFKATDGNRYIGTAGHCTLAGFGEIVYRPGQGPEARDAEGRRIGEIGYAILGDKRDFALIRLDQGVKARAKVCYWGGPTGSNRSRKESPTILRFFGNGILIGNAGVINQPTLPARSALAPNLSDPDFVWAYGVGAFGDSGSGVLDDEGRAVGVLVALGVDGVGITRLAPQIRLAEKAMGLKLKLVKRRLA